VAIGGGKQIASSEFQHSFLASGANVLHDDVLVGDARHQRAFFGPFGDQAQGGLFAQHKSGIRQFNAHHFD